MNKLYRKWVLPFLGALLLSACSVSDKQLEETLSNAGYTDVVNKGYQFLACGRDDSFSSGFTARNALGKPVSGVVCCGLLKGCTVRF